MASSGLLVIGSGPGIGVTTASLFTQKSFSKIALISRDKTRLSKDRDTILKAANLPARQSKLNCVLFNAARMETSDLLTFPEEEILKDFKTTTIALYNSAKWALPLLSALKPTDKPSILVTRSLLPQEPIPFVFLLSLVKAAQRNLVQSLAMANPNVHIALLNIGRQVTWEDKCFNPPAIAEKLWELYSRENDAWTP